MNPKFSSDADVVSHLDSDILQVEMFVENGYE